MTYTTVFEQAGITPPIAPPDSFVPDNNGFDVPPGNKSFRLFIDQSNIPPNTMYGFDVEFQTEDVWQLRAGAIFGGGPIQLDEGGISFINYLSSEIASWDDDGRLIGAYPTRCRIRIKLYGAWLIPLLTMVFSSDFGG